VAIFPVDDKLAALQSGGAHISTEAYCSPEIFALERDKIFKHCWLFVGRVEEIPASGDFFVSELPTTGVSVLVTRGRDLSIRAFHNVCSHRQSKLVLQRRGNKSQFSCPYHAWQYRTDGSLLNIPDSACFARVNKAELGLTPITLDVWEGFIFVHLDAEPEVSLREYLGDYVQLFKDAPFGACTTSWQATAVVNANWRLGFEGNLEMYHFPVLHNRSAAKMVVSPQSPFPKFLLAQTVGPHIILALPGNHEFRPTPDEHVLAFVLATGARLTGAGTDEAPFATHPGFNRTKSPDWSVEAISFFPDTIVVISPFFYIVERFTPVAPNRYAWEGRMYFKRARNFTERFVQEFWVARNKETLKEDMILLETQQAAIETGVRKSMIFGDQEVALRYLSETINRWLHGPAARRTSHATQDARV
jgi:phenylpropionate dioxygenase-like ring-hydroxylating dioxygenase large terminal subunit